MRSSVTLTSLRFCCPCPLFFFAQGVISCVSPVSLRELGPQSLAALSLTDQLFQIPVSVPSDSLDTLLPNPKIRSFWRSPLSPFRWSPNSSPFRSGFKVNLPAISPHWTAPSFPRSYLFSCSFSFFSALFFLTQQHDPGTGRSLYTDPVQRTSPEFAFACTPPPRFSFFSVQIPMVGSVALSRDSLPSIRVDGFFLCVRRVYPSPGFQFFLGMFSEGFR